MPQEYPCPHGCKTQYPITTLRGWKRHMSAKHGHYSEAELERASRGENPAQDVETRMSAFAESLGSSDVPVSIEKDGSVKPIEGQEPVLLPATHKVRATPRKIKRILSGIPEKILEQLDITPDSEDREAIDEAMDFLQEIFGVDFEVDESKTTIRSRWWAFLWVGGVIGLVVAKHKAATIFKFMIPQEEQPAPVEAPKE